MVTTRSKTKSLPEKSKTLQEEQEQPTSLRVKHASSSSSRPKKQAVKCKAKTVSKSRADKSSAGATAVQPVAKSRIAQSSTPLLDLPAELRNEIYSYIVGPSNFSAGVQVAHELPYVREPSLLFVSRQIRSEALPIWYGENIFQISGSSPAVKFLRSRHPEQLRNLRTLRVDVTNLMSAEYARDRIKQLMKEFGPRGLPRNAIQFQINTKLSGWMWASLITLNEIEEAGEELIPASLAMEFNARFGR